MEIVVSYDPWSRQFENAIKAEIVGVEKESTWKIVSKSNIFKSETVLGGTFELAIKNSGTTYEALKARFIVQGYKDAMKSSLVHNVYVARQYSTKLIVSLAVIFNFRLFSTSVNQAYLQSTEKL